MSSARTVIAAMLIGLASLAPSAADTDEDLVARLSAGAWREREAATRALLDRPSARTLIEAASTGADPEARWRAQWVRDGLDWGLDTILALQLGNPFFRWRGMPPDELGTVLQAVMQCPNPARIRVVLQALRLTSDPELRAIALDGLRQRPAGAVEWAKGGLASDDRATRVGAALVLALWGDSGGAEVLATDLESGQPLYGHAETIEALIGLGERAGLAVVLASIRDAVRRKRLPSPQEIAAISRAPVGTPAVEAALLEVLEAEWGEGIASSETTDQVVTALGRCGGPTSVLRLVAWWEQAPEDRSAAIPVAVAIADGPGRAALAQTVARVLGGDAATPDDLFVMAALQRLAGLKDAHAETVARLAAQDGAPSSFERVAEVALTLLEAGDGKGAEVYLRRARKKEGDHFGPLLLLLREAVVAAGKAGSTVEVDLNYNNEAWGLVSHPERLAHPGLAIRLAEWTTKNAPGDLAQRGTQGAAYYRAGRLEDAVKLLEQNLVPFYQGKQEDMAFLAMAYQRLGREDDARAVDAKCRAWEAADGDPNVMRSELERVLHEVRTAK